MLYFMFSIKSYSGMCVGGSYFCFIFFLILKVPSDFMKSQISSVPWLVLPCFSICIATEVDVQLETLLMLSSFLLA